MFTVFSGEFIRCTACGQADIPVVMVHDSGGYQDDHDAFICLGCTKKVIQAFDIERLQQVRGKYTDLLPPTEQFLAERREA